MRFPFEKPAWPPDMALSWRRLRARAGTVTPGLRLSCQRLNSGHWWSMIFSENRYPLFGIML